MALLSLVSVILISFISSLWCQKINTTSSVPQMIGLRVENSEVLLPYRSNQTLTLVHTKKPVTLSIYGRCLSQVLVVRLTTLGFDCVNRSAASTSDVDKFIAKNDERLQLGTQFSEPGKRYFFCLGFLNNDWDSLITFKLQGTDLRLVVATAATPPSRYLYFKTFPLWSIVLVILLLVVLGALFSVFKIGLTTFDIRELQVILKAGRKPDKAAAAKILPVRSNGNYLLCTVILVFAVVQSAVPILCHSLIHAFSAILAASAGIFLFAEILPQSICTRYGLVVVSSTIAVVKLFMLLTAPVSWPVSKVLDLVLGKDARRGYSKERLVELIRISQQKQKDLRDCQEVAIISGALQMSRKTVRDIMTRENRMFMVADDSVLDTETVSIIVHSGFSRIPVFHGTRGNVVGLLHIKDLAIIDPEDRIPLSKVCQFYQRPMRFVDENTPLKTMLDEFKRGQYHIAFAVRPSSNNSRQSEQSRDTFRRTSIKSQHSSSAPTLKFSQLEHSYTESPPTPTVVDNELTGLVTLEDIIEEIIQSEIEDESDIATKLRMVRRKSTKVVNAWLRPQSGALEMRSRQVPEHLIEKTQKFLAATFRCFHEEYVTEEVLRRLVQLKCRHSQRGEDECFYTKGVSDNHFILILEGIVQVCASDEQFRFEVGSFHHFAKVILERTLDQVLAKQGPSGDSEAGFAQEISFFVPDFTAKPLGQVLYLKINSNDYSRAFNVSKLDREERESFGESPPSPSSPSSPNFAFSPTSQPLFPLFLNKRRRKKSKSETGKTVKFLGKMEHPPSKQVQR